MARFAPKNTLPALGGLLGAALLIGYAPAAAEGAMRGLSACGRVILPAVFPFLAVSVFLAGAPGGAGLAALLSGVMRYCFRLPAAAAPALLMSWIGGYPAGAKTLAELRRQGASYSCDTLAALREQYPADELFFLMGSDMFLSFETWRRPEEICRLATLAVFSRRAADEAAAFARQKEKLEKAFSARVTVVMNPEVIEVSSTQLREELARGRGRAYLTEPVYGYILRKGLYGTATDLKHLTPEELRPIALSYLKPKRMSHVLGTEQEAAFLAEKYGADVTAARIAALLHDCTKKLDLPQQLSLCRHYAIPLDEMERNYLKLLHSKTGAAVARDRFGVSDEIYNAIFYHTTGKADMTLLEKIIYLADYIEPSRSFPGVEELRTAVHEDLDRGLCRALADSIVELQGYGSPVHPNTQEALSYIQREIGGTIE